ncbi:hypothetical protein TWF694_008301 [Orbilia ellipsospora]|uniref:F-box domain-containing protein n=1 Tax=Orbilia ellipsospora TaxID=2528407 RepID=A0AAV9XFR6_9PEZI
MASLSALPLELLDHITSYLVAIDVASLALTCHALLSKLGSGNPYRWFQYLRPGGAYDVERFGTVVTQETSEFEILNSGLDKFDEEGQYWKYATNTFMVKTPHGCSRCLDLRVSKHGFVIFQAKGKERRYCLGCFNYGAILMKNFEERYPDVSVPESYIWEHRLPKYLLAPHAIRLIESQVGPMSYAITPSSRFLGAWRTAAVGRAGMIERAEILDQVIELTISHYRDTYPHLHCFIRPDDFHRALSSCLVRYLTDDADDRPFKLAKTIAPTIHSIADNLHGDDGEAQAMDSIRNLLRWIFRTPDGFKPHSETPSPKFLRGHMKYRGSILFGWAMKFSIKYFGGEQNNNGMRCYWCLKENPQDETLYDYYDNDGEDISEKWFVTHFIREHRELLLKRPKSELNGVDLNYNYWEDYVKWRSPIWGRATNFLRFERDFYTWWKQHEATKAAGEVIGAKYFENEELEDLPRALRVSVYPRTVLSDYYTI